MNSSLMNHQSNDIPWKESNFHSNNNNNNATTTSRCQNQLRQSDDDEDEDEITNDDEDLFFGMFADPEPYETYQFDFSTSIKITLKGQKQEIGQLLNSTGLTLWRASHMLCRYLVDHDVDIVRNKTILELGAGMGLCSILAHKLGATHVYATDGDTETLKNLRRNVDINDCRPSGFSSNQLIWGYSKQYPNEKIDVIIGADVVYAEKMLEPFWKTISSTFSKSSPQTGIVVLAYTRRNVSINLVFEYASNHGFICTSSPNDDNDDDGVDGIYLFSRKEVV